MSNEQIIVYGATWCPDCRRSKQFLGEHRIPFNWVDIQQDASAVETVERINNGNRSIPTIVFPDGDIMVEPSNSELAEKLGLKMQASRSYYDVIIIGGGPAGLTTAIYTTREGLDTLVIEKSALGGQVGISQILDNYPGFEEGISGAELADRLGRQAARFGAEMLTATAVESITREDRYLHVRTTSGDDYTARAVVIATGSKYRRLNVPGEDTLIGASIHFCATCDGAFYQDKEVLVIGGGNSGFEEGLFLTKFASHVTIVEYLPEVKASKILQQKVAKRDDMTIVTNHAVKAFTKNDEGKLATVQVEDRATGEIKEWNPEGAFVFIGLAPNTQFDMPGVERDRFNFIQTDNTLMTSVPGVFAAGDVRAGSTKQAAAAAGEGATVALMMRQYLQSIGEPGRPTLEPETI